MHRSIQYNQHSVKAKTQSRLEAINDARNAISMIICAMLINKMLLNIGMFFNMDATGFEHRTIRKDAKTTTVWAAPEVVLDMEREKRPLASQEPIPSTTGVFIKHHTLVSAHGNSAPFVFSVADKSMKKHETKFNKVSGLGMNSQEEGYLCFHQGRNATNMFYLWYYKTIAIPFFKQQRQRLGLAETAWGVFWIDGESVAMDPVFELELRDLFCQNYILVIKGPASTTEITQLLDASMVFRLSHAFAFGKDASLFAQYEKQMSKQLSDALKSQAIVQGKQSCISDSSRQTKLLRCVLTAVYGLRMSITPSNVLAGLHRTGIFSVQGPYNPELILAKFGVPVKDFDVATLLDECRSLVSVFKYRGFVTDRQIESTSLMKARFFWGTDSPEEKPRDLRAMNRQRCVLLSNADIKLTFEEHKKDAKQATKATAKATGTPPKVGAKIPTASKPVAKRNKSSASRAVTKHVLVADGPLDRQQALLAAGLSTNAARVRGAVRE